MAATTIIPDCAAAWLVKRKREALTRNPCLDLPATPEPECLQMVLVREDNEAVIELWYNGKERPTIGSILGNNNNNNNWMQQEVIYSHISDGGVVIGKRVWVQPIQRTPIRPEMRFHKVMHYRTTLFTDLPYQVS